MMRYCIGDFALEIKLEWMALLEDEMIARFACSESEAPVFSFREATMDPSVFVGSRVLKRTGGYELLQTEKGLFLLNHWVACRFGYGIWLSELSGETSIYFNPDMKQHALSASFLLCTVGLHRMGFLLSINTNASMIDEEAIQWLKEEAPTRMNITLYGASRETYGRICANADGFDKAMRAIHWLKEADIPVVINASMIPENGEDMEKIMEIGRSLGLNTRLSTYMFPPVRREREHSDSRFSPQEAAKMFMRRCRCQFSPKALEEMFRKKANASTETGGRRTNLCVAGRAEAASLSRGREKCLLAVCSHSRSRQILSMNRSSNAGIS